MQEKSFYFLVEISLICENVMSVMSEGLTSAASESTMRLISGSVTATRELSAIKGCDLSTSATYLRVYTVIRKYNKAGGWDGVNMLGASKRWTTTVPEEKLKMVNVDWYSDCD